MLILSRVEPSFVLSHPIHHVLFRLAGILHDVGMRFALVRFKGLHPIFEGLTLGLVVAEVAIKGFHELVLISIKENKLPQGSSF